MRVFFAIPIDESSKDEITAIQNRLKSSYQGHYTDRDNLHITLVFVGNIDENTIYMLTEICKNNISVPTKFKISARGIDSFKNGEVTYLKVEKSKELEVLNSYIENRLSSLGIDFERRDEFCPHITLRRGKRENIREESETIEINADSFALYESKRIDGELRYVPIKIFGGDGL